MTDLKKEMIEEFEEYLKKVCFEESPDVLDGDRADFFDTWLTELSVEDYLRYGNKCADKATQEAKEYYELKLKNEEVAIQTKATLDERKRCAEIASKDQFPPPKYGGCSCHCHPEQCEARFQNIPHDGCQVECNHCKIAEAIRATK